MRYTIRRAPELLGTPAAQVRTALWDAAEALQVTHYQRADSGHRPPTRARLLYDDAWLAVRFEVDDLYVRAVAERFNDMVCKDSCVEFFVAPSADPARSAYFNFEVNCGGTMLLYRCASPPTPVEQRDWLHLDPADGATIRIAATLPRRVEPEIAAPTAWAVEYHVPWALFHKHFDVATPVAGTIWRGNFYKCGDATSHPHWGAWAPLGSLEGGFHQPAWFQPLQFA